MSLLNDASLVMIPSGYKDTKLYSVKPTNGDGDFTFSRGSNLAATRVNSEGLIEKGRENLIVYSQDFSNANWSTNASATISHGITDPNGGSTASRITFAANVNSGIYQQNPTLFASNNIRTSSLYMKGAVGGEVVMFGDATNRTIVTLTTSWVRYEGFAIDASTYFIIYTNTSSPSADTIDIAFVQYENGLVATDYIETTTTTAQAGILEDMPRLDYSGGATCPSLLLETSRTNAITSSEYFDGGSLNNTTISAEYNTADTLSPEGVYNAAKLTATGNFPRYYDYPSTSDNTDIVISSFAKAGDASVYSLFASDKNLDAAQVFFDLSAGTATLAGISVLTPVGYDIEPMGNGWYRCWLSINTGTGASSVQIRPISHAQGQTGGWSGSNYIYAYGAQYEIGSYPTSYIPTYGASVTRGADDCSKTGISSLIGQTEGTLFCDFVFNGNPTSVDYAIFIIGAIGSNYVTIGGYNTSLYARVFDSTLQGTINALSMVAGTRYKVAIGYANNDVVMYVNGVNEGSDTSASIPTLSQASFSRPSFEAKTDINQALLFKTRLTNDELASLTTI